MRCVVAALALWLCAAIPAFAQNAGNLPIVGILRINTTDNAEPSATGFKDALAAFGWIDWRGSKLLTSRDFVMTPVAPSRGRGSKQPLADGFPSSRVVAPSRGRGSKP